MMARLIAGVMMALLAGSTCATVEANRATRAELEAVKGIGPTLADAILDERRHGPFRHWSDLMARVRGVRQASAGKLSSAGLRVEGAAFEGAASAAARHRRARGEADASAAQ